MNDATNARIAEQTWKIRAPAKLAVVSLSVALHDACGSPRWVEVLARENKSESIEEKKDALREVGRAIR